MLLLRALAHLNWISPALRALEGAEPIALDPARGG